MNLKTKINGYHFLILLLILMGVLSTIFHEWIWEVLLLGLAYSKNLLLKLLLVIKKFFFKGGIVSFATIAWKRIFITGGLALGKRAIINTITDFFQDHIVKPLIEPSLRYIKIKWELFKLSNLLNKLLILIFSSIPATLMLWIIGLLEALWFILQKVSLAQFLTMILKLLGFVWLFFQSFWRQWIQPYIDLILMTLIIGFIEKIPWVGGLVRRTRITVKWYWRKVHHRKERMVKQHVAHNVDKVKQRLHQHVDNKQKIVEARLKQKHSPPKKQEEES